MLQEINEEILIFMHSFTNYEIIQPIVIIFADSPIFFLPIFLVFTWFYYTYSSLFLKSGKKVLKEKLLFIFYSTIIAVLINYIIKYFFEIDRPEEALEGIGNLLLNHIPDNSFPSDHSAVGVAFLTSLFLASYKKIAYIFLPLVIIMLLSRIVIGVHWPFDILAGTIVGILSAFISFKVLIKNKLVKKLNLFIIKILSFIKF